MGVRREEHLKAEHMFGWVELHARIEDSRDVDQHGGTLRNGANGAPLVRLVEVGG